MIFLIWTSVLIAVIVLYFNTVYSRFSDCGVKHLRVVPFFGNMAGILLRRRHFCDHLDRLYHTFKNERFVGNYEFIKPTVMIRDIDLVKKITIKDFEYFIDHRAFADDKVEPLFARNLFALKGDEWKDMRSTLSPAFTSSKIKLMVPFMKEVGDQMIRALKKKIGESTTGHIDVDCKDLTSRYANDVIASCAFGLKVDSHTDEENQFYKMGKLASEFKLRQMLFFFVVSACPGLAKYLKISLFTSRTKDFFIELVTSTMKNREMKNIIRPDMIHLLMEAKKGHLAHEEKTKNDVIQDTGFATVEESAVGKKSINRVWSDNDLTAQAVLFFIAGFETISIAMSFALHELAIHPEVQDRLVKEIKEEHVKNGGKLNFNSIQNMSYMDMVTSEVLRLWPPILALDRQCLKDYNMGKPNSKSTKDFIMKQSEILAIPIWCFHHDQEFFPDPYKFDPERFSEENKHKINPMAYMPFGIGPRNCIGSDLSISRYGYGKFGFSMGSEAQLAMYISKKGKNGARIIVAPGSRFALCELKSLLYQILLHVEVSPSERTCFPAQLSTESFNPRMLGGHWLRFKMRD